MMDGSHPHTLITGWEPTIAELRTAALAAPRTMFRFPPLGWFQVATFGTRVAIGSRPPPIWVFISAHCEREIMDGTFEHIDDRYLAIRELGAS